MGCMLRSDLMSFCDIYLQSDTAFEVITQLGEMECVQFIDMTPELKPVARNYMTEVCRCVEMERKLLYIEEEMMKDKIPITNVEREPRPLQLKDMAALENILEKWESEILDMSEGQSILLKNYLKLTEMYYVLHHIGPMMGDTNITQKSLLQRSGKNDVGFTGRLFILTGVVKRSKSFTFEMVLWRISRGNIYYRQASQDTILQDPETGQEIRKVAFLAICQGEQLSARMEKVCRGFRVNIYKCPKDFAERMDMMTQLEIRIDDLKQVMKKTNFHRCKALRTIGKQWNTWMVQIKKSKAVYHNMNMFSLDITKECLIGQCWVPDDDLPNVTKTLEEVSKKAGTNVPSFIYKSETSVEPPTYHRTNKFTKGFQALINAYGHSKYRELNPALYTIITFPFLFAMMFGDVCHGLILVAFSAWMLSMEKKYINQTSKNEIWNIFFGGRYVILMMGLFSIFTGFFYNVYFSKPIMLMAPYWKNNYDRTTIESNAILTLDPAAESNRPYIFGVDPIWSLAKNEIMYLNSIKMKMSIIFGIVHMVFGLLLSLFNHIYFKEYYAIPLQFLPRMIYLTFLFVWLIILIFMKWFMFSGKAVNVKRSPKCAPLILILFIDMLLLSTTEPVHEDCDAYMFASQKLVQRILLFVSLLCVPVMLFGIPVCLHRLYKRKKEKALKNISQFRRYQLGNVDEEVEKKILAEVSKYSISFGTLMINQAIHTIEFVLSTISHTASYLRLWALSLAHDQLSDMLWHMMFAKLALRDTSLLGGLKIFVVFAIWAIFTISILVVMEGLSAFLHTLRLHWVEFMSKFYSGTGWPFTPFSFKNILYPERKVDEPETFCKKEI